jgi:hypothetical protein
MNMELPPLPAGADWQRGADLLRALPPPDNAEDAALVQRIVAWLDYLASVASAFESQERQRAGLVKQPTRQ